MASFFIGRPIVAIVIALVITLAGAVTASRLPVAQYPEMVPPEISITTSYPGADAVTVEQAVAAPIEQQMSGVEGMIYQKSTNASDGTMNLRVTFHVGTPINIASVLAQNRVQQALSALPEPVQRLGLQLQASRSSPLMIVALYDRSGRHDARFLANYATITLNDRLLRVPGVGQVVVFGAATYAMRIWIDPDRLARLSLTATDVMAALRSQNVENPAGQLGGEPALPGTPFTYTVRAQGRLARPEQFGAILLRTNPDGSTVRLADVARVELGSQTYAQLGRFRGQPASIIALFQSPGSNALEAVAGIRAALREMQGQFPAGVTHEEALDTTASVRAGIKEIVVTLLLATLLVLLVVYLFLQSWRATLIPMVTVPVSLVGAFVAFPLFGFSINTLSLFGLVLAIGLVVDDAIVVVEAVQRHIEEGLAPPEAAQAAMREVSSPVVAIALILSAVFLPVAFAGGITGRLYQQFAVTVAVSVLISALNALTLSPALSALLLRARPPRQGLLARLFGGFNRGFDGVRHRYLGVTSLALRRTGLVALVLVLFTGAAGLLGNRVPGGFVPEEDQGYLFVNLTLPDAASLQRTDGAMRQVEEILRSTRGVAGYTTVAGYSILRGASAPFTGLAFVSLEPWDRRDDAATSLPGILGTLARRFAAIPGAQVIPIAPPPLPGLGTSGGFSLYLQDQSGTLSPAQLGRQTERFVAAASRRPELARVVTTFHAGVPQRFARVDRERVLRQGLTLAEVHSTLGTFLGGSFVNQFNRFGRTWNVYVEADARYRTGERDLDLFFVRNRDGVMVPLSTVVTLDATAGPDFVNRFNLQRAAYVTGAAAPGYSSGQALAALAEVARQVLPPTMRFEWSDLSRQEAEAPGVAGVFLLALLVVFLILAALYESWSLPFSVLLVTPVAICGALLGLLVRGLAFNVYAQIGLVMLVGLAAKNSILIVEFARAELARGATIEEAAERAARLRLRPILMTAFAFILGALPLWIASGAGAQARRILGTVVVAGMLLATVLGIVITPALFVLVERLLARARRWRQRPGPQKAPSPVGTEQPA